MKMVLREFSVAAKFPSLSDLGIFEQLDPRANRGLFGDHN